MITTTQLRQKYLDFFRSKGHHVIPSASLIPENDPTVLFTTAGMHPLVPYLLSEPHPEGKKLTSVQKCIRTGDIDEVGDNRHLTFFEMLGNWSLGDYFKEQAVAWSFEFLTSEQWLNINPERLYVSVFAGDQDAPMDQDTVGYWQQAFKSRSLSAQLGDYSQGIKEGERIFAYPKNKNWWGPAGQTGPCGPDTEIFYDTLSAITNKSEHAPGWTDQVPCHPNCDCGRYLEIWNNVFMQYNKQADGSFVPLKQQNVDTGMGLERTVAVINGIEVFGVDTFAPLINKIEELTNKNYGDYVKEFRIIADHIKAAVFIIADGIKPSNTDQGYVVRRLLRRAIRYGQIIGLPKSALGLDLVKVVVDLYKDVYTNLSLGEKLIKEEIIKEEDKFSKALDRGLKEFSKLEKIDGKAAFDLYQSYGFPLELTEELARERKLNINKEEFTAEFKKHQELSRVASAGKFKGGLADHSEQVVKMHTATHLLHQALRDVLGDQVEQRGSNITPERLRFDFSQDVKLTPEELKKVEQIVNDKIKQALPVHFELLTVTEAKQRGAIGLFDDKYAQLGNKVKVYFVGDYSAEICGGPHVSNTLTIGSFKILKEEAVSAGVRRIKAVVG